MDEDQAQLLAGPRVGLARARAEPSAWAELAFAAESVDQGRVVDRNRAARFGVVWAAQYDRRPADLPLLRFLFEQEIIRYRRTVTSGMGPDLELAGFLLAEHRQVQDVWLHWQAKQISFDTALGYRMYQLLTAGVAATVAEIRAHDRPYPDRPDRDRLLQEITGARNKDGTARFTDSAVAAWLDHQRSKYPADPDAENLQVWANHAARLREPELSRRFLLQWARDEPRTQQLLNTVQFHLAELGYLAEAIEIQTEAVTSGEPGWEKASNLLRLFDLHHRAGDFAAARQALRDCAQTMPTDPFWKDAGLWRHFVRDHFLLVPMAPDPQTAQQLFEEGDQHRHGVHRLWMDGVLDAALAAAEHTGQAGHRDRYLAIQQAENHARDVEPQQTPRPPADDNSTTSTPTADQT